MLIATSGDEVIVRVPNWFAQRGFVQRGFDLNLQQRHDLPHGGAEHYHGRARQSGFFPNRL